LVLFGSFARGEVHPGSDVNLLVEFGAGAQALQMRLSIAVPCLKQVLLPPVEMGLALTAPENMLI
jgi:predicted nucleotidyltransferase